MFTKFMNIVIILMAFLINFAFILQYHSTFAQEQHLLSEVSGKFDQSHSNYNSLLKKYVHNGRVNYKGFLSSEDRFNSYLDQIGSVSADDFKTWSRDQKLAFWINAYNAFTIKAVIDNYPIERNFGISALIYPENSIRQINGVWDKLKFKAAGKKVTLNEIEHQILRKKFNEPRIHFTIVCASIGCPDLNNEAYKANIINTQLDTAAVNFVNNPQKGVKIDRDNKTIMLSAIFNWFGKDFIPKYGDTDLFRGRSEQERAVLNFISIYLESPNDKKFVEQNDFRIKYMDYDWSLNEMNSK